MQILGWGDNDICFVLDQLKTPQIYMSLQSDTCGIVIILIPNHPIIVLSLTPDLAQKPRNANVIIFGLTCLDLEPTIYHTWDEQTNHNSTNAVNL